MELDTCFWRDRRVLVTGHTGFKGSWLSIWLNSLGARVTGLSLDPPSDPNMFDDANVGLLVDDRRADIRDCSELSRVVAEAAPEVLFHLAAQAIVRDGYRDPVGTFATNVLGTVHVLESMRHLPSIRAVVVVTSDKCYENDEAGRAFREGDRLGGHDPYSSSKACAELVTDSYRRSFLRHGHVAVSTVRAGNVIGGGDWARNRLLPDLIRGFAAAIPARIRNPRAVRPWQHVLEPLMGCLMLAERLFEGQRHFDRAWNLGPAPQDARRVQDVAERAAAAWGPEARWEIDVGDQPHEAGFLSIDSTDARETLRWRPHWSVERSIDETVAWYRAHARGEDMRSYTANQIRSYVEGPCDAA
jgi:CDP-glucose 4,6-dehydratase